MRWLGSGAAAVVLALASAASADPGGGELEPGVLAEVNRVREHPVQYADELAAAGSQTPTTREAIAWLEGREPAPPLEPTPALASSADLHALDEGQHGAFEHTGTDGSSAGQRMRRAGVWAGMLAEEMAAGPATPREVVRQLIVDEDVPGRGHRKDLMDPLLRRAGVGCAAHPVYGEICVIDLASAPPPR
ncbi:MAG TPA: CAP domain-containing protein [Caulobacteraceae bacterium]|nr:CAP domain-containing protein [Caulobacteraceae bacterium]